MKLEMITNFMCKNLWGSSEADYSFRPYVGASGGLLSLWDINEVVVKFSMSIENLLIIKESQSMSLLMLLMIVVVR